MFLIITKGIIIYYYYKKSKTIHLSSVLKYPMFSWTVTTVVDESSSPPGVAEETTATFVCLDSTHKKEAAVTSKVWVEGFRRRVNNTFKQLY